MHAGNEIQSRVACATTLGREIAQLLVTVRRCTITCSSMYRAIDATRSSCGCPIFFGIRSLLVGRNLDQIAVGISAIHRHQGAHGALLGGQESVDTVYNVPACRYEGFGIQGHTTLDTAFWYGGPPLFSA